jgi:hypothetical protein
MVVGVVSEHRRVTAARMCCLRFRDDRPGKTILQVRCECGPVHADGGREQVRNSRIFTNGEVNRSGTDCLIEIDRTLRKGEGPHIEIIPRHAIKQQNASQLTIERVHVPIPNIHPSLATSAEETPTQ